MPICMKPERWCFRFVFVFKFQVEQLAMPWFYIWSSEGFINIQRVRVLFLTCIWGWKDDSVGRGEALAEQALPRKDPFPEPM